MADTPDFGVTGYSKDTADRTARLNVDLSALLAQLESISVNTLNIEQATLDVVGATLVEGAPLRYKSGKPIFIETFELNNPMWASFTSGTGASAAWSTDGWWVKGRSWKLVAGSDGSRYATIVAELSSYPLGAMGAQFAHTLDTKTDYVYFNAMYHDGVWRRQVSLKVDVVNKRLSIYGSGAVWSNVYTFPGLRTTTKCWHFVKLRYNLLTDAYIDLWFDDVVVDLSSYMIYKTSYTTWWYTYFQFSHYGVAGSNPVAYIDEVCVTDES